MQGRGRTRNGSRPRSRRLAHGTTPQNEAPRTHDLPLLSPIIRTLSERTIAQIRSEFPGWDIYALQAAFNEWLDEDPARTPEELRGRILWLGAPAPRAQPLPGVLKAVPDTPMEHGSPRTCIDDISDDLSKDHRGIRNALLNGHPLHAINLWITLDNIDIATGIRNKSSGYQERFDRGIRNIHSGYQEQAGSASH